MKNHVTERLAALREIMKEQNLAACCVPTADFHLSEYVGAHFKVREWLSGFTGSAGTLVVLREEAGLWTDGRYFLQAEQELAGSGITLFRDGLPDTPSIEDFLCEKLTAGDTAALDGRTISADYGQKLADVLSEAGISLRSDFDPAEKLWTDRPPLSDAPAWLYDELSAGQSLVGKIAAVRKQMEKEGSDVHVTAMLDEIAWLFNLRGSDVDYNPVLLSYAAITADAVHLFADSAKLPPEVWAYLSAADVTLHGYNDIFGWLAALPEGTRVLVDPKQLNYTLYQCLVSADAEILAEENPVQLLKAVKNTAEIAGTRRAHVRDGVAMVRFMKWLKEHVPAGGCTEASAAEYLDDLRRRTEGFVDLSFPTISGYGPHGAIVHYAVSEESNAPLNARGLLLVDSGGHYRDGTTDITRTFALGPLTAEEKKHFALVLRAMLNLMYAVFPEGITGRQLDAVARMPIWQEHLDFLHGTGHGVGHLLNVHEGPNNISWRRRPGVEPVALVPGMITTDEPGIYIAGSHGIRLENELLCVEKEVNEYGKFLGFEALTLAPLDLDAVDPSLLTATDRARLNAYHRRVYETLAAELTGEERDWLENYTREI